MPERRKNWLDFLADLWSGRVHNTLAHLLTLITKLEEKTTMKQEDVEQKLGQVAEGIEKAVGGIRTGIEGLRGQMNALRTQAESPTAGKPDIKGLEDEFAKIDNALGGLQQVAQDLTGATDASGVAGTAPLPEGATAAMTVNEPSRPGSGLNTAERLAAGPGARVGDVDPAPQGVVPIPPDDGGASTSGALVGSGSALDAESTQRQGVIATDRAGILSDDVQANSAVWGSLSETDRAQWGSYSDEEKLAAAQRAGVVVGGIGSGDDDEGV